jgi:MFS family permease
MKPIEADAATAASTALKDSPQRWWLMALIVFSMLACYGHRNALNVAAPFIKDFELTAFEKGVLLSAFSWAYSFMQMPSGWLVDRFGVRRAYSVGYVFWSAFAILTGAAKNLVQLILMRVMLGVGQAVAFPASARAVANWFQESERGMVTGIYLAGVRYGAALISIIGGWFLSRYDWRWFFVVTGALPLVWVLPWMLFLRKWEEPVAAASGNAAKPQSASFRESLMLMRHRSVLGIFLGFFAYDYAWFVYLTWLPSYLKDARGFSAAEMGVYNAVPLVAMSVIILISGTISDRLVRRGFEEIRVRKIFIVTGLIVGCLVVPAAMVEDKMTSVWLLTISLSGLGIASPNTWTLTQAVCEKKIVGTVSGIQNFGGNIGGIIAPALTGYIVHATGSFALAMWVIGGMLAAGVFAYWLLIAERVEIGD